MHPDYWKERWVEGRIGFHEGRPNDFLIEHAARLGDAARILVPLCGKAEDMAWLAARGNEVVGVDVAEPALRAFFAEHGLTPAEGHTGAFTRLASGPITLFAGDFFAIDRAVVGAVDAFYDRASVVALPEFMRHEYVKALRSLFSPGARGLVITFEYPEDQMEGPPFSVREAEIRSLYEGASVELLGEREAALLRGRATTPAPVERAYLITL